MWNESPTQPKSPCSAARSAAVSELSKCTRMKNRPLSRSPYCWLWMMLHRCWTRKLETAYTMPGTSAQDRVRMNSGRWAELVGGADGADIVDLFSSADGDLTSRSG